MDSSTPKKIKPGAVAHLREYYNKNLRKQPVSPELHETLKKREPVKKEQPKKIARSDRDAEIS